MHPAHDTSARDRADGSSLDVLSQLSPARPPQGVQGVHAPVTPSVEVYLLSPFKVLVNHHPIEDWPTGKGKSVFKYLLMHRSQPVPREVLMDVFWPGAAPHAARNNLNVAVYGLRRALAQAEPAFAFVLYRQGCYAFHPALNLWVDAEAFVERLHSAQVADQRGDVDTAMAEYRIAQALHLRPLLSDDRYEDWLIPQRQDLQTRCQKLLERLAAHHFERGEFEACASAADRMIALDACNEAAHELLMRCYSRLGQAHLALRQYHFCVDALARELRLIPSAHTVALYQQIRSRQAV